MKEFTDMELLDAYARERSEEAFRELVGRHVDFTYSAALRLLRNPHLAQEATQSAFIALAGKAGRLHRHTIVAGWLHRAVHFAALKLQRSEARRKHWEEEAATMNLNSPGEAESAPHEQALPHVDGALAELSECDRDAVILRFLQQRSLRDVAQTLGTSEEAAKKRVSRALERLRGLLARRGVAVPVAVLAAGLAQLPVTAAPAAFSASVATLAVNAAAPAAAGSGVFLAMTASAKVKLGLIAALVLLGGTAALWWHKRPASGRSRQAATPAAVAAALNPTVNTPASTVQLKLTSVLVDDQAKALKFYTETLGFLKKKDLPTGKDRWLTVVSSEGPDDVELLLEPMGFPAAQTYQKALFEAGIPLTSFGVGDIQKEYERLQGLGVEFSMKPTPVGPTTVAVFADTCGNRIQLVQPPRAANAPVGPALQIRLTSVLVDDQAKALRFYTEVLGLVKKRDMPAGKDRWLTVVSPEEPDGLELLLEPNRFAAAQTFQQALFQAGIPLTAFAVLDTRMEYDRMKKLGVKFRMKPTRTGPTTVATFDDTCGNLIQIYQR